MAIIQNFFIILLILAVPISFFIFDYIRIKKIETIKNMEFPKLWEEIMKENFRVYNYLPDFLKIELKKNILIFIAEKNFEGCNGIVINEEIKVIIAAHACLLILNRENFIYPKLHNILVYPSMYVVKNVLSPNGLVMENVRIGESWPNGSVVLAWDHVKRAGESFGDGDNVALHEFAHQLDQEKGYADGAPYLGKKENYSSWYNIFTKEYENLRLNLRRNIESVMNEYGALNPAEFFAVATETFFEKPGEMVEKHPELYDELKKYYKVNPVDWLKGGEK